MLKKHSVTLYGHTTSITLEDIFWDGLKEIAEKRAMTLQKLLEEIDESRTGNLSSALRVYVCEYYKNSC